MVPGRETASGFVVVVLEEAAHDLAGGRDGHRVDELHDAGGLVGRELFAAMGHELVLVAVLSGLRTTLGLGQLAFDLVGDSRDGGERDCWMRLHLDTLLASAVHSSSSTRTVRAGLLRRGWLSFSSFRQ